MNIKTNSLQYYIDKLKSNEKFSFTRWGDGEWGCVFGAEGHNVDRHQYFPEMSEGLLEALVVDKGYIKATWPLTVPMFSRINPLITEFIEVNDIDYEWHDARVWEEEAMKGKLNPLIKQLEEMDFIVVSEESKRRLSVKYTDFIEVPAVDCFLEKDSIKEKVIDMCDKYDKPVFGFSASMATNVIVDELHSVVGDKCWMIDFGSIWDPFVGNITRSYHHRYESKEIK